MRAPDPGPPPGRIDRWLRRIWSGRAFIPAVPRGVRSLARRIVREIEDAASDPSPAEVARVKAALRAAPTAAASLAAAFVLVARTVRRETGLRPYPEQIVGALLIHGGRVAEMATGEGKTLTVMMAAAVRALSGTPVHVVTVNDYLARRDFELARATLESLGLGCGLIIAELPLGDRPRAYLADVVYASNKELAFDHLRARLAWPGRQPRGLAREAARISGRAAGAGGDVRRQFAIIDEADSVLLDEALTPLVIAEETDDSEGAERATHMALALARELIEGEHFDLDLPSSRVTLTAAGERRTTSQLDLRPEGLEIARHKVDLVTKALRALHLLHRDRAYIVQDGAIRIVDEGTGRVLGDRSWEGGLHQMVEAKEGVELTRPRRNVERSSFQQFFALYHTLAGTSGTAREVASEFLEHYRLRVVPVPSHRPSRRVTLETRVFLSRSAQYRHVCERIAELVRDGRPVLVGTRSVGESERLASRLRKAGIAFSLLNARFTADEAATVAAAGLPGRVTVATNMAGRGTDIALGPGVAERGGLHVILTELHDARRIDRQLAGRCARQGDPGSFERVLRIDARGTLVPAIDRLVLRHLRRRWPRSGTGLLPRLLLLARGAAQRLREREHAAIRRRIVADETRATGAGDL